MEIDLNVGVDVNKNLIYLPQTVSTSIPASGVGQIYIAPPSGKLGTVNSMYVNIPAVSGATSGTHYLSVSAGTTNAGAIIEISANYNQAIVIQGVSPVGSGTPIPNDVGAFVAGILNLLFDNGLPLYFKYTNNTNAAQSGNRIYNTMYVLEEENTSF